MGNYPENIIRATDQFRLKWSVLPIKEKSLGCLQKKQRIHLKVILGNFGSAKKKSKRLFWLNLMALKLKFTSQKIILLSFPHLLCTITGERLRYIPMIWKVRYIKSN